MKPDARLRLHGAGRMSDSELWTVVLSSSKAAEAVARYVPGLDDVAEPELRAAVLELGRRYLSYRRPASKQIRCAADVYQLVGPRLHGLRQEHFVALALDSKNRVLRVFEIARGHLAGVEVHPSQVFRPLVREGVQSTILAHNHPSGDTEPSAEDIALTRRLKHAGDLMEIRVLDHVVVGNGSYTSLAEMGILCR